MLKKEDYYGSSFMPLVGVVEEVLDEAYVRVRVYGIHPIDRNAVPTDALPAALVVYPVTGGQVSSGSISHNLQVDSWVIGYWLDFPYCQQLIVTGSIQGTDYSMSTYGSQGGSFVGEGSAVEGGDSGTDGVDSGATTNIPGGSNIQKTYNYVTTKLVAEGGTNNHLHASALVGVLMLETSGINPTVVGGYRGRAWGICQWLGSRRDNLFRRYGRTKRLDQQLDFMWWELNGPESSAKRLWLRAGNLPDAVAGFCMFERAEEVRNGVVMRSHGNFKKRLQFAYQVYNSMSQTGTATSSTPTTGGRIGPV